MPQQQHFVQIITGLMTFFTVLVTLINQIPSVIPPGLFGGGSTIATAVPPFPTADTTYPMVVATGDGTVYINSVSLDLDMASVRGATTLFPPVGWPEYLDDGRSVTRYDYKSARYYFEGQKLVRIATPRTPDKLVLGDDISRAFSLYGQPVHCYWSSTKENFCGFVSSQAHGTAWIIRYHPDTRAITGIWLADNLLQLQADERHARIEAERAQRNAR